MTFRENAYIKDAFLGKPRFAGGNYFVYGTTRLNDVLDKKIKAIYTYPESYIELEDGTKIAWFGKDIEVHIWQENSK